MHETAARGVQGAGQQVPHHERIQSSFGRHDISDVRAHVGGVAADAAGSIGARAYATGNDVAFAESPDLHTTAHEVAHVVQQRRGIQLYGGVGRQGDPFEDNADRVADAVVRGESAETLLDATATGGPSRPSLVQRQVGGAPATPKSDATVRIATALQRLIASTSQAQQVAKRLRTSELSPSEACIEIIHLIGHSWADLQRLAGSRRKIDDLDASVENARFRSLPNAIEARQASDDEANALRDALPVVRDDLHQLDGAIRAVVSLSLRATPRPREVAIVRSQYQVLIAAAKPLGWAPVSSVDLEHDNDDRGRHMDAAAIDESTNVESTSAASEREYTGHGVESLDSDNYRIWGFDVGSSELPSSAAKTLDMIADAALADGTVTITLVGHTSSSGTDAHNEKLSEDRAYRLLEELVSRGIDESRITAAGEGESVHLVDERADPARMARNRRVEVRLRGLAGVRGAREDNSPALGCADLRTQARWERIHYEAWVNWWTDGGYGSSPGAGIKDRVDGDSIRPSERNVRWAANTYGIHDEHDIKALMEQISPLPVGANLDAHMRDLKQSAARSEAMARDFTKCDPKKPALLKLMTYDDVKGPNDALNPPANSRAPGGQRH
ncbi:MAG TPA: OmpA family protein [Kofleriaceae bacterium]|nr:OmpA family protein [Kofleriaceae bacterium]